MANPVDIVNSQPQSGKRDHTQESGDAGLSSNMYHTFDEHYKETDLPVEDTGGLVRPILREDCVMSHCAEMAEMMSVPLQIFPLSQPASAKEGFRHLDQHLHVTEVDSKEEAVETLPATATISHKEGRREPKMDVRMDTGKAPGKSPPKERRKSNAFKKRPANLGLVVILAVFLCVTVCAGSDAVGCFTCMDKERCQDLSVIYRPNDDTQLYKRENNERFPECSGIRPLRNTSCDVCHSHSNILIHCVNAYSIDAEDKRGRISNISEGCDQEVTTRRPGGEENSPPSPNHGHIGLFCSLGALLFCILVGVVVYIWKSKRTENGHPV